MYNEHEVYWIDLWNLYAEASCVEHGGGMVVIWHLGAGTCNPDQQESSSSNKL